MRKKNIHILEPLLAHNISLRLVQILSLKQVFISLGLRFLVISRLMGYCSCNQVLAFLSYYSHLCDIFLGSNDLVLLDSYSCNSIIIQLGIVGLFCQNNINCCKLLLQQLNIFLLNWVFDNSHILKYLIGIEHLLLDHVYWSCCRQFQILNDINTRMLSQNLN